MCKINLDKSFADTAAFALCAVADSIVYPSITFTHTHHLSGGYCVDSKEKFCLGHLWELKG